MTNVEVAPSEVEYDTNLDESLHDEYQPYRAVSRAAIASIFLAIIGLGWVFSYSLLVFAIAGIGFALAAMGNIRRYPQEVVGKGLARLGLVSCVLVVGSAIGIGVAQSIFEVPEGYTELSFRDLKLDKQRPVFSPELHALDGQKVFIRGYVHPGVADYGDVKKFVLVGDMGVCCFGGQPEPYDMIEVSIAGEDSVKYSRKLRKLGGVLRLQAPKKAVGSINGGFYRLEADLVK